MAISFTGIVKSQIIFGNDSVSQNIFTIENGFASRVDVYVRRLIFQEDAIAAYTAVMPLVKSCRATSISGGTILEKGPFDTTQVSDPNVICRAQDQDAARITATPGDTVWQEFPIRMHTGAEQQQGLDNYIRTIIPALSNVQNFVLHPGESLLVRVVSPVVAANPYNSNYWFVECVLEENQFPTFTISGTVTLNSTPVDGAKVMIVEADDVLLTNAHLREVITTPAGGAWSSTIRQGKVGAAFVQYKNGSTYYTAPGSPFLS